MTAAKMRPWLRMMRLHGTMLCITNLCSNFMVHDTVVWQMQMCAFHHQNLRLMLVMGPQGMSDLAAPILYVVRGEAEAFWCFKNLMDSMEGNFHPDSAGTGAPLRTPCL